MESTELVHVVNRCACGCGASIRKQSQYARGHNPKPRVAPAERFWRRVEKSEGGCWLWMGGDQGTGYGVFHNGTKHVVAHRFAYELLVGPIPAGLTLDHLCRVRNCVNPEHLEPVTNRENILRGEGASAQAARKTHCPQGHPYSGDNLRVRSNGCRECITCTRQRDRDRYEYRSGKAAA